jgi:hypothetical protein
VRKWVVKKTLLFGMLGGALGGIAMKTVVALVDHGKADRSPFGLSRKTDAAAAHEVCRRMRLTQLSERHAEQAGAAMHYAFAVAAGMAYAACRGRFPQIRAARGAAFGTALWLVGDEAAVSLQDWKIRFGPRCSRTSRHSALTYSME